jgi:predicted SnoaL-like aldol condensation-catalyzing enzyme
VNNEAVARSALSSNRRIHRVLSEGDRVVIHSEVVETDGKPTAVAFDLWQVTDGAISGHWGDVEPLADSTANGHTQTDGAAAVDLDADSAVTRRVATGAVQEILVNGRVDLLDTYLAGESYVQHNPRFADGVSGLVAALGELAQQGITMRYDRIHHVVVEGNFGYLHSTGHFADEAYVFHDLFRVADGKCVEHWDVMVPTSLTE